jgi:hypothetical protein
LRFNLIFFLNNSQVQEGIFEDGLLNGKGMITFFDEKSSSGEEDLFEDRYPKIKGTIDGIGHGAACEIKTRNKFTFKQSYNKNNLIKILKLIKKSYNKDR